MKIDIGFAARLTVLAMLLALAGCASPLDNRNYQEGSRLWDEGRYNEALALLAKAADEEQGSAEVRQAYYRRLNDLVARFTADADNARVAGRWADAENLYRQALALKPGDERASAGLRLLEAERRHASMLESAGEKAKKGDYAAARALVDQVLKENPRHPGARGLEREFAAKRRGEAFAVPALKSSLTKPVTLEFRDASLKMVLEALSRTAGINFIFDRDVKGDARTTVFVRNVRVEDALDLILSPLQLDKKIISDNTVMIYPATPAKTKEHQDLVIRSFYLGNADPKQTVNMIKTVLKTKDVFVDERVNLLIMRDTPEAVELAERLIVTQDLAEPEVLLEIEVLEVNTQRLLDLGIKWPTTFTGPSGTLKNTFDNLSSSTITVDRGLIATLKAEDADTRLLARPQVRVRNREKAKVHIGDRVPVISAVVTPSTGTPVVTDQVQYIDVGIKLDLEPAVHLNTDVGLRIGLEVSTFQRLPPTANGTSVIQVSTRNATTVLRLKEGETSILAGLIQNLQTTTVQKVPFIGDVPVVGRLFSNTADDNRQTEIVFLITPRVVRNVEPPDVKYAEFWSGTEAQVKTRGPM
ncbi:MAG TPA: secretin and TonB N-terminal domain-containing protein, partial [Pelomicrobium sp.]|nr:secretin and TonB N-terminal domain-containing protein [Pelomicrobium sp.]